MKKSYNQLSWSISRSTLLHYCQKKYFFTYYTNFLKEFDIPFWLQCLLIKNLQSLDMRVWHKTHQLLSDYLTKIGNWDRNIITQELFENIKEEMINEFEKSKNKDYTKYDKNNKFGLNEHYRWENIDNLLENKIDKIQNHFNNFLSNELHSQILKYLQNIENKCFVEEREANFEKMKFTIENIPWLENIVIWAQPDFGVVVNKNKYIIYDRKTGQIPNKEKDDVSNQLKVYAYKILLKIWLDKIDQVSFEWLEVYTNNMDIFWWNISKQDLEYIEWKILSDVNLEKSLLSDTENNIPKSTKFFNKTKNENKCKSCRFNKVCEKLTDYETDDIN
jgi:hypothetical protein